LTLLNYAEQIVAAVADGEVAKFTRVSHPDRERSAISVERRVSDLIAAGWRALGPGSGPVAVQQWRRRVFDYMTAVYGADHVYTRHFQNCVRQGEKNGKETSWKLKYLRE
jgi:hypothetical protein